MREAASEGEIRLASPEKVQQECLGVVGKREAEVGEAERKDDGETLSLLPSLSPFLSLFTMGCGFSLNPLPRLMSN